MAAYYTSQAYDAPAATIWPILTDFRSWPNWFPNVAEIRIESDGGVAQGTRLLAVADEPGIWTRWEVVDSRAPRLLVCEHVESNAPMASQVQAAYLQFELIDDDDGCVLEVEIGAEGYGLVGDFFVGMGVGSGVRRILPQLVDAFSEHVVQRVRAEQ
jgi:uncharacterized protein YndB with AHSA1/START domain